jgi:hypothetical protein
MQRKLAAEQRILLQVLAALYVFIGTGRRSIQTCMMRTYEEVDAGEVYRGQEEVL